MTHFQKPEKYELELQRRWDVPEEQSIIIMQVEVDPDEVLVDDDVTVRYVRSLLDGEWLDDWIVWQVGEGFVEIGNAGEYYPARWRKLGSKRWGRSKRI